MLLSPGISYAATAHDGTVTRSGFAASDVGLFACAAIGIWLALRSMRARARRQD